MKRKPTANPSSLFLLELIFAILFFSVEVLSAYRFL